MLSILGMILPNNLSNGPLFLANKAVSSLFALITVLLLDIPSLTMFLSPSSAIQPPAIPPNQLPIPAPAIEPRGPKKLPKAPPAILPIPAPIAFPILVFF